MTIEAIRKAYEDLTDVQAAYKTINPARFDFEDSGLMRTIGKQMDACLDALDDAISETEIEGLEVETHEATDNEQ